MCTSKGLLQQDGQEALYRPKMLPDDILAFKLVEANEFQKIFL